MGIATSTPLEGENLASASMQDVDHWIHVYAELLGFKLKLLARVRHELPRLNPVARSAATVDIQIIESQMAGYRKRLQLWFQRMLEMQQFRIDPEASRLAVGERETELAPADMRAMQYLLDNPHWPQSPSEIMAAAWGPEDQDPDAWQASVRRLRQALGKIRAPFRLTQRSGSYTIEIPTD